MLPAFYAVLIFQQEASCVLNVFLVCLQSVEVAVLAVAVVALAVVGALVAVVVHLVTLHTVELAGALVPVSCSSS